MSTHTSDPSLARYALVQMLALLSIITFVGVIALPDFTTGARTINVNRAAGPLSRKTEFLLVDETYRDHVSSIGGGRDAGEVEPIASFLWPSAPRMLQLGFGIVLTGMISGLAAIDLSRMILPDRLNLKLGALGLGQNFGVGLPHPSDGLLGSLVGVTVLFEMAEAFRKLRGIDGLGLGDQKFIAAAELRIGWPGLPLMLLVAAASALTFALVRAAANKAFDPGRGSRSARSWGSAPWRHGWQW
jgi:leader peptidase (prepilin peptidase) / N-methyltransferase